MEDSDFIPSLISKKQIVLYAVLIAVNLRLIYGVKQKAQRPKIMKPHFQCVLKHCIVAVEKLQKEVKKIRDKAILATSEQQYTMSESIYPSPGH